ncbi:MAG: right-handed parallel beta-helix repeat-containing protein, partial [Candidatus Hadarchaeaceae archaeon]
MPSIWVSDEDYETLIDIKADLEKHRKKPASFSDVVSHLMVKKRMLGGKSRKEVKNKRRAIRAKALTAAISALMLLSLISAFQVAPVSAQGPQTLEVFGPITQLTIDNGHYLGSFSPDGSKIVYTGTGGIWVMNADGSDPHLIYNSGTRPKWGPPLEGYPDGLIALAGTGITIITSDGTLVKTIDITHSYPPDPSRTETQTHSLDWSPDGTKIAFATASWTSAIWVVDYNTGTLTQITDYSQSAYAPAWSPDGTEIACSWGPSTNMYVGVFKSDGSQKTPLRTIGAGGRYGGDYPDWGSNGKIVYSVGDAKQLYVMDSDGTDNVKISDGPAVMAAWSSDCKKLVYIDGFANKNIFTLSYPYATIQSAIDAASPGDTINVAAGAYTQTANLVIDEEVSILGVSETKPTIQFDEEFSVVIEADNVLLEHLSFYKTNKEITWSNFILEVPKGGWPDYESLYGGLAIRDCVFEGGQDGAMYINMKGDFTVESSEFIDYAAYATIQIAAFDGTVTISGNKFTGSGRRVIVVEPGPSAQILHGGTMNIIGNTVVGDEESIWFGSFFVYNHWANPSEKVDINIEKNILEDITGDAISIWTCGEADLSKLGSVKITGNTFSNIGKSAIIVDTTEAPSYGIPTNPVGKLSVTANLNNFYSTVYGIKNEYVAEDPALSTIDATLNWWGDPTGPRNPTTNSSATGDDVSDNVDYMPWLDAPHPDGKARNWNVQNVDTENNFNSIQEAIDNASEGETVLVGPGTYDEYVDIDKPLTLSGQSGAIVKPTSPAGTIISIQADDVTVEGFEVDGSSGGGAICAGIGSIHWTPDGTTKWNGYKNITIRNNTVHDIQNDTDKGLGISLWRNDGHTYENILIEGNTVYNTGRMGIYIGAIKFDYSEWLLSASNTIKGNVVHDTMLNPNAGETFPGGCGGIALDAAKDCTIEGNTVYNSGTSDNPMPGIFLAHGSAAGNKILGNEVYNQAYGIAVEIDREDVVFDGDPPATPEVHYNNIHNNDQYGLIVLNADEKVVDATLNWWGDPSGPGGVGLGTGDNVSVNANYASWLPRPLPTISDISISGVTTTSATITWTTALPADSRVKYGSTIAYGLTSSIPNLTTSHSLGLTELTPSTTYHFRVRSEDAYGHVDNSGDLTFITAAPPPPVTLTVGTTPIKANVYVNGSLWGVAPRTRSLAAGTYTISFGDVLGYLPPAPEIVTLAAGETRTVTGVYTEIPPENIENQSPTYDLPSVTPEENTTIQIENTTLTEITIQVENTAENVKITVQEVTEGTAGIAIGAPGATYKYLNIVAENITDAQI